MQNTDHGVDGLSLQISISGMALIFVTRTPKFSWLSRPGNLLFVAFFGSQLISSIISGFGLNGYPFPPDTVKAQYAVQWDGAFTGQAPVYGSEGFYQPSVIGCGCWVLVAWVWSIIWYGKGTLPNQLLAVYVLWSSTFSYKWTGFLHGKMPQFIY